MTLSLPPVGRDIGVWIAIASTTACSGAKSDYHHALDCLGAVTMVSSLTDLGADGKALTQQWQDRVMQSGGRAGYSVEQVNVDIGDAMMAPMDKLTKVPDENIEVFRTEMVRQGKLALRCSKELS